MEVKITIEAQKPDRSSKNSWHFQEVYQQRKTFIDFDLLGIILSFNNSEKGKEEIEIVEGKEEE